MLVSKNAVSESVCFLLAMAVAVGLYLVLAYATGVISKDDLNVIKFKKMQAKSLDGQTGKV
jgi:hypothetical protein